jgi:hypothetical protein
MAKIEERIETLKERLKQLETRKTRAEARKRALLARRARKDDTRRKILAGAIVLTRVEQGKIAEAEFRAWLEAGLTRADDRALFDLPPLPGSKTGV